MLLEISEEITSERMKGWIQSKNNTQLSLVPIYICQIIINPITYFLKEWHGAF